MKGKDIELLMHIYDYINRYIRDNHHAPNQNEVAAAMNISPESAYKYLKAMGETEIIFYNNKRTGTEQSEKCYTDYVIVPIIGSIECGDPE